MSREKDAARREFVSEAEEIIETLSGDVAGFETGLKAGAVKPAVVNKIFREVHSLKGLAGMLGFEKVSTLSHDLEDLLDRLRLGKIPPSHGLVNILFESIELLTQLIASISRQGEEGEVDVVPLTSQIHTLAMQKAEAAEDVSLDWLDLDESTRKSFTEYEEHRLLENLRQQNAIYGVTVGFAFDVFDAELKKVMDALNEEGEVISTLPSSGEAEPGKIFFRLIFASNLPRDKVEALAAPFGGGVQPLLKRTFGPPTPPAPPPPVPEAGEDLGAEGVDLKSISSTVRVDIQKLDAVMNIVGELVLSKTALLRLSRQAASEHGATPLAFELVKAARTLDRKVAALQASIIDVRMVPIGQIFNKLSRAARKISARNRKKIDLRFSGGDTELDKVMIEEITNPFLHLIRNAIDHGVESPEGRRAKGKPEEGVVELKAYQKGNSVVVEISDDGGGIRPERIREAAVQQGIIAPDAELTFDECINLIFKPGFSSARMVSDISGRGVGLDVVKANIMRLKGSIQVHSEVGRGTTFEIVLPITLAILQVLLVESGGKRFAIPLTSVSESLRITPEQIKTVEHREVYHLRDQTLPLVRLERFFNLAAPESPLGTTSPAAARNGRLFVVVVQAAERRAGLVVERLAGEQEVVIKSIGTTLSGLAGLAGVCELGETELVLVLDIGSLLESVSEERSAAAAPTT
jgi:two-component system chemotaxis sensor kinase CheA